MILLITEVQTSLSFWTRFRTAGTARLFLKKFKIDDPESLCMCVCPSQAIPRELLLLSYCIDGRIYLNLVQINSKRHRAETFKPAVNGGYLICNSLPYYLH